MPFKPFLAAAALALAASPLPASAQQETPAATDSGVVVAPKAKRIPLEQFMVPVGCPEGSEEICVEGRPEIDEEEPAPLPGDRKLDIAAERRALSNLGADTPSTCTAVGAGGGSKCVFETYEQYERERELLEAKNLPDEPE